MLREPGWCSTSLVRDTDTYVIRVEELLPKALRELREGLDSRPDQQTAARLGGVGRQQLSDYERGVKTPSLEVLGRILDGWRRSFVDLDTALARAAGQSAPIAERLERLEERVGLSKKSEAKIVEHPNQPLHVDEDVRGLANHFGLTDRLEELQQELDRIRPTPPPDGSGSRRAARKG